jgi:hypothetical protein
MRQLFAWATSCVRNTLAVTGYECQQLLDTKLHSVLDLTTSIRWALALIVQYVSQRRHAKQGAGAA